MLSKYRAESRKHVHIVSPDTPDLEMFLNDLAEDTAVFFNAGVYAGLTVWYKSHQSFKSIFRHGAILENCQFQSINNEVTDVEFIEFHIRSPRSPHTPTEETSNT